MLIEKDSKPNSRYLFAEEFFSDDSIKIWQEECIRRNKDREKGLAYYNYVKWERQENQIAVFTLYAYADFGIPRWFDCIFSCDNPSEFLRINYELTQSIHEAWFPVEYIGHGHKHLCVFTFENSVPEIFNLLNKMEGQFSTSTKEQTSLGFCNSNDFEAIKVRIEKVLKLKSVHGDKWCNFDDGE